MRRPLIIAVGLAAVVLARPVGDADAVLPTLTGDGGGVEVTVTPVRVDGRGAVFDVALDTHTVELDVEPAGRSALTVGSTPWGGGRWQGDPAGGHHVQGQLSFPARGPAEGSVRLVLAGLPSPVTLEWNLETP